VVKPAICWSYSLCIQRVAVGLSFRSADNPFTKRSSEACCPPVSQSMKAVALWMVLASAPHR
jgi:hypothetical protein